MDSIREEIELIARERQKRELAETDFYELPSASKRYTPEFLAAMMKHRDDVRAWDDGADFPNKFPVRPVP